MRSFRIVACVPWVTTHVCGNTLPQLINHRNSSSLSIYY